MVVIAIIVGGDIVVIVVPVNRRARSIASIQVRIRTGIGVGGVVIAAARVKKLVVDRSANVPVQRQVGFRCVSGWISRSQRVDVVAVNESVNVPIEPFITAILRKIEGGYRFVKVGNTWNDFHGRQS